MPEIRCRAILFDLDGVLVDSSACVKRLWRAWAERRGVDADRVMKVMHGRRSAETIGMTAPTLDAAAEADALAEVEASDVVGVEAIAGAAKLVRELPAGLWGVVTSCYRQVAVRRLQEAGVPVPGLLIAAEDVRQGKPHPEGYSMGATCLGVSPDDCLVVEDAPAGIEAGRAAGIRVLGVASTHRATDLHRADWVVERLSDLALGVDGGGIRLSWGG